MRSNRRTLTLLFAMALCLIPSFALAGANAVLVERPAAGHKFLDAKNVALHGISALMMAADIATTNQALKVPGTYELNPLSQTSASRYALKVAGFGAGLGLAYAMHKAGHHKAERIIPMVFGIPSAVAAVHNAGIHK